MPAECKKCRRWERLAKTLPHLREYYKLVIQIGILEDRLNGAYSHMRNQTNAWKNTAVENARLKRELHLLGIQIERLRDAQLEANHLKVDLTVCQAVNTFFDE